MSGKPFSIRLTTEERARLERSAGNKPLGEYIRLKLLGDEATVRKPLRRPKIDQRVLARILAALGSSDVASSMRDIASAARNGALPESPDMLLDLQAACLTIQKMRVDLIAALGIKPED